MTAIHQAAENDSAGHEAMAGMRTRCGAAAIPRVRAMAPWTRRRGPMVAVGMLPVVRMQDSE